MIEERLKLFPLYVLKKCFTKQNVQTTDFSSSINFKIAQLFAINTPTVSNTVESHVISCDFKRNTRFVFTPNVSFSKEITHAIETRFLNPARVVI